MLRTHYFSAIIFILPLLATAEIFKGTLYEKGSDRKKILFTFKHEDLPQKAGEDAKSINTFTDTEGVVALTENVTLDAAGNLKSLIIDQTQTGERGELTVDGKVNFSWTKDGKTKTSTEKIPNNLVVAATLVPYLQKHWDELVAGKDVEVRFGALDRRETVGFEFFKIEEKTLNGKEVMKVKMKPSSFIIAAIVDPLFFTFDKKTKRLVELLGRTAPKRKIGNSWKDLDADIVYEYSN